MSHDPTNPACAKNYRCGRECNCASKNIPEGIRKCWFKIRTRWIPGRWHCWSQWSDGTDSGPIGVVEDLSGRMYEFIPSDIYFGEKQPDV